jgi:hypothetical protein
LRQINDDRWTWRIFIIASRRLRQQRIEDGRVPPLPSLVLFGDEMPIRETKKMMRTTVAIGVTLAMLIGLLPRSCPPLLGPKWT